MIKTVIFDIDNTLYNYDRAHEKAMGFLTLYAEEKLGIPRERFLPLYVEIQNMLNTYMGDVAAIHNRTIRFQHILEHEGLPLYPHVLEMDRIYWGELIRASEISDGAPEAICFLREHKKRIGIGTDMTARVQFRKLTALGLLPYIDFFVSSEEACVEKPHPAFFARCVEKSGCRKEECLFVGDSLKKDVLGAIDAGLKAVWYCPKGYRKEADVPQLVSMAQLPELVSEM